MRLIDADTLREKVNNCFEDVFNNISNSSDFITFAQFVDKLIDNAPTVEERPQGEWIEENTETGALGIKYTWFKCSQCGWDSSLVIPNNFCPNCGADMRGKEE